MNNPVKFEAQKIKNFRTKYSNIYRCNFKTSPIILPMFQESQRNPWITEMPFGLTKKSHSG